MAGKHNHPEDDLQRAVVDLLAVWERQGHLSYFAVPNGGKRGRLEAARLKGLGVRAGIPDLVVMIPPRDFPGVRAPKSAPKTIFLELKSPKGKLSERQVTCKNWLQHNGFPWFLIRSIDDVIANISPLIGVTARAA